MYERIFDLSDDDRLICSEVSHLSALCYAGLIFYADSTGRVTEWHRLLTVLNVTYKTWKDVVEPELVNAALVEIQWEEGCYGRNKVFQICAFTLPSRLDRLSAKAWDRLRRAVFERDDYTCRYCDTRGGELECDHVIPIARGGTNEMGNLVTACKKCNQHKRDKALTEWRA